MHLFADHFPVEVAGGKYRHRGEAFLDRFELRGLLLAPAGE